MLRGPLTKLEEAGRPRPLATSGRCGTMAEQQRRVWIRRRTLKTACVLRRSAGGGAGRNFDPALRAGIEVASAPQADEVGHIGAFSHLSAPLDQVFPLLRRRLTGVESISRTSRAAIFDRASPSSRSTRFWRHKVSTSLPSKISTRPE